MPSISILSSDVALFPSFVGLPFRVTLFCSIRVSAFRREVYPEFAMIFCNLSIVVLEFR